MIPIYKFRDWVPVEEYMNKQEGQLYEDHLHGFWHSVSRNPYAISFLEKNQDKIIWEELSENPNMVRYFLDKYPETIDKIVFKYLTYTALNDYDKTQYGGPYNSDMKTKNKLSQQVFALFKYIFEKFPKIIENEEFIKSIARFSSTYQDISYLDRIITEDIVSFLIYATEKIPQLVDLLEWWCLSACSNTIPLLKKYPEQTDLYYLLKNESSEKLEVMKQIFDIYGIENYYNWNINDLWGYLGSNPDALSLIENHLEYVNSYSLWYELSKNPCALHILDKYPNKIDWEGLKDNPNPDIYTLVEKYRFGEGENIDKNIRNFWDSPHLFTYDYDAMRDSNRELKEAIIQEAWHPSRIQKWLDAGVDLEDL